MLLFVLWLPAVVGMVGGFFSRIWRATRGRTPLCVFLMYCPVRPRNHVTFDSPKPRPVMRALLDVSANVRPLALTKSSGMPGAGDLLLGLWGPAVLSFAAPLYR